MEITESPRMVPLLELLCLPYEENKSTTGFPRQTTTAGKVSGTYPGEIAYYSTIIDSWSTDETTGSASAFDALPYSIEICPAVTP